MGHGTTFKIYLPHDPTATASAIKPQMLPGRSTGSETILVVEDEDALREATRRSLAAAGYTVLTAKDGAEAVLVCKHQAGDIHLLLTDVVMPGIGGRKLAQKLCKIRPHLKILFMSGYTNDAISRHGVLEPGTHFLGKPFSLNDLKWKVREVLDGGVTNLMVEPSPTVTPDAGREEQPFDLNAFRGIPKDLLGKLRGAVIAARYDEIGEILEAIRAVEPAAATHLRRMADLFDYPGMLDFLHMGKEAQSGG
jgi:CheY-like chemotaxis protein